MEVKKFFGQNEVFFATETDKLTDLGSPIVEVTFANGKKKLVPKKAYEALSTDSVLDLTAFRNAKFTKLVPMLMGVIGEFDIAYEDLEGLTQSLKTSMTINFNKAIHFALHGNVDDFDTASYPTDTMEWGQVHEWLRKIPQKNDTNTANKEGGAEVK